MSIGRFPSTQGDFSLLRTSPRDLRDPTLPHRHLLKKFLPRERRERRGEGQALAQAPDTIPLSVLRLIPTLTITFHRPSRHLASLQIPLNCQMAVSSRNYTATRARVIATHVSRAHGSNRAVPDKTEDSNESRETLDADLQSETDLPPTRKTESS